MIPIYSRFNPPPSVDTKFEGETMTQQHFQDEVDINNIIKRYSSTGFLVDPLTSPSGQPMFGDFSDVIDFHTAQNYIANAFQSFELLPAEIRTRFNNDPGELISFLDNPDNIEEGTRLGLFSQNTDVSTRLVTDSVSTGDVTAMGAASPAVGSTAV